MEAKASKHASKREHACARVRVCVRVSSRVASARARALARSLMATWLGMPAVEHKLPAGWSHTSAQGSKPSSLQERNQRERERSSCSICISASSPAPVTVVPAHAQRCSPGLMRSVEQRASRGCACRTGRTRRSRWRGRGRLCLSGSSRLRRTPIRHNHCFRRPLHHSQPALPSRPQRRRGEEQARTTAFRSGRA